jgi:hypothetical protein
MGWGKTWTVMFRCINCDEKFTLRHVAFERINVLQAIYPCPSCGAQPVKGRSGEYTGRAHALVDLTDTMETVYRKTKDGETWHFHPDCAHWPSDEYIELEAPPRLGQFCNECTAKTSIAKEIN